MRHSAFKRGKYTFICANIQAMYVNKNAKIVIECELHANVRFLALMNASSCYCSSFHANECVFSGNEQQKVYYSKMYAMVSLHANIFATLYQ